MKARVLCLVLICLALAGCDYALPSLTFVPEQATLGPVTPLVAAPTSTPARLPTNTPVSLSELHTQNAPTATGLPTSSPPPTAALQPTRLVPVVGLPTSADLGIMPTPIPSATSTPRPTVPPPPLPQPVITRFLAQVASVDPLPLALRTLEVPLAWTVQDRAPGTNLVFEQVFPDGRVLNVERPRHFTAIPSEGSGSVAPFLPGGDARSITLRLRVVHMATRRTLAQADLTLPVNPLPDSGFVTASGEACFQQPYIPSSGLAPGVRGVVSQNVLAGVPLTAISGVGGQVIGSLARGETFTVVEGPFCFRPPGSPTNYRQWLVRAVSGGQQGWALEYAGTFTSYTSYLFPQRDYVVYDPAQCYSAPFLPDRGVRVGRGVTLTEGLTYGLAAHATTGDSGEPQQVGEFMPGEVLTVLEGPYCFRFEPMPQTMLGQRQWRLRSETSGLTGWVYEYSNERQPNLQPVANGGEPDFQILSFDVQPRSVTAGQPLTITWEVTGANGVDVLMWHDALPANSVSLSGTGALLPLSGSLTVNAPDDVTAARFSIFGADSQGRDGIEVTIACRYPWFSSAVANRFCPNGTAQSLQGAYQPFENGYMVWFNGQIWAVWGAGSGAIYPDSWGGGDVTYPEAPPEGRYQPVRGFGTLWVSDANVRQNLGWATAPEQGYTLQYQATDLIHRPGLRGGYNAADILLSLPDGRLLAATRSGNYLSPRMP